MRDHSDALCQLEPSDAHASMVTSSFHLDPRHFASVWDGRLGLYAEIYLEPIKNPDFKSGATPSKIQRLIQIFGDFHQCCVP